MNRAQTGDMLLYGRASDNVCFGNKCWKVCSSFRAVLGVLRYIELSGDMKTAAKMFFEGDMPDDDTAVKLMTEFIGEEFIPDGRKAYSFYNDADLIAGAFMSCYGIDIFSEDMHWHRFRALFLSLDGDCAFSRLIRCRRGDHSDTEQRLAARRVCRKYYLI